MCRDSNKTSLLTTLASHQVEVRDGGIARDDLATLTSSLQAALETSDLVVSLVTLKFSQSWRRPSLCFTFKTLLKHYAKGALTHGK